MNDGVIAAVRAARDRAVRQLAALEQSLRSIVEGSELAATDDEHDPEGATIAYERAQTIALLRQARLDIERLDGALVALAKGEAICCASCGRAIPGERIEALPTARTCVECARRGDID
jgi:RNA polymerase-binding transcription factor DksA